MNFREGLWGDPRNWEKLSGTTLADTNPDGVLTIEKLRAMAARFQGMVPMKVMVGVPNVDGVVHMERDDCDWWLMSRPAFAALEQQTQRERASAAPTANDIIGVRPQTFAGAAVYFYNGDCGEMPNALGAQVMWWFVAIITGLLAAIVAWMAVAP